jgi:hypothetical protein
LNGSAKVTLVALVAIIGAAATLWFLLQREPPADDYKAPRRPARESSNTNTASNAGEGPTTPIKPISIQPFQPDAERPLGDFPRVTSEARIEGVVVGPSEQPVAGATIRLMSDRSGIRGRAEEGEVLAEGVTGVDGRYRFELPTRRGT